MTMATEKIRLTPEHTVFLAGHRGLVGRALYRALRRRGHPAEKILMRDRAQLDLGRQAPVEAFFREHRPDAVLLAAARVGGIAANASRPVEFITENLAIELHVLQAARAAGVELVLFLGSSCIYPRLAPQPMREEHLLGGPLEPTNEPYAIAKIAGVKMCEAYHRQHGVRYLPVMPTNLYGPGDNFDLETSHVLPALLRRMHEAAQRGDDQVVIWGTGRPRREFLHVDDLADACLYLVCETHEHELTNIGTGRDCSIAELARIIAQVTGFTGELVFDTDRPDGAPRKLLDVSKLEALGWRARIGLREGIERTYQWYTEHLEDARGVE